MTLAQFAQSIPVTSNQGFFLGPTPVLELAFAADGSEFGAELFLIKNAFWWVGGGVLGTLGIPVSQKVSLGI